MRTDQPIIVTAAELGQIFDLSERSIREHRARGHVVRAGNGYDYARSVRGMMDHLRVESAKKGRGEPGQALWESYRDALAYRTKLHDERDRLWGFLLTILATPGLPEAVHALVQDFIDGSPQAEGDEDADG